MNRKIRIQRLAPQGRELWQTLFYRHQQQSRRRRLLALKAIWDGQSLIQVCRSQGRPAQDAGKMAGQLPARRLRRLARPPKAAARANLEPAAAESPAPCPAPQDPGGLWHRQPPMRPAPCARQWLDEKWHVALGATRLYGIFDELGLSHQRAHRDYGPGRPGERAEFVEALKKKPGSPSPAPPS